MDGTNAKITVVKKVDSGSTYIHYCVPAMFLVAARDVVNFVHEIELEDDSYLNVVVWASEAFPDFKFVEGGVRAKPLIGVTHFVELPDNRCKITNIFHGDLGGSIPSMFVNWMAGAYHTNFTMIKAELEK